MPKKAPLKSAKLSVIEPGHTRPGTHVEKRSQNSREVPSTGPASMQATIQLLLIESDHLGLRALEMCDEAATLLMEEAGAAAAQKSNTAESAKAAQEDDFSPREAAGESAAAGNSATSVVREDSPQTKKLEATYLLVAGAVCGMGAHGLEGAARLSLRLAKRALALMPGPMTQLTLAMSCYGMRRVLPFFQPSGRPSEDLPSIIVTLSQNAITTLARASTLLPEEQCYYVRALWLLALLGHVEDVAAHLNRLITMNPSNYLALLLTAMVHTMYGDNSAALVAALHVEEHYVEDPCAAAVTALLRQAERQPGVAGTSAGSPREDGDSAAVVGIDEELGVALARTSTFSGVAADLDELGNRKRALKALCVHCAPGEETATTLHLSATELKRRAAGHWLLLAHVATRAGAFSLAELALESLLTHLAKHKQLLTMSYAAALTGYALLIFARRLDEAGDQLSTSVARLLHAVVRPLKAQAQRQAPPQRCTFGLPPAAVGSGASSSSPSVADANNNSNGIERGTDSNWRSNAAFAENCLEKASQVAPYYSEVYIGLGTLRLLAASQPELSADERDVKLVEASDAFMRAVQCAPTRPAAYMGMGCSLEAQGAMEESLDFYAAATELSAQEPLIALDYFVYMFE